MTPVLFVLRYGFPMWACKTLNLPRPDGDMDPKEAIAPHVYRMYVNLLEMGKLLQVIPNTDGPTALATLTLIPSTPTLMTSSKP